MGSVVIVGMIWRATSVPLSWLISATIDTASGDSAAFAARVSVPVIVAVAAADGGASVTAMSAVGPPVMTGMGSVLW